MKKLLALALTGACGIAAAQTPAANLMPDGSHDMYIGLGASVQPRYEGADDKRTRALPLLQVQFSNGVFLAGMSAGWHLSQQPGLEYGPLLAIQPRRSQSGTGGVIGDTAELSSLAPMPARTLSSIPNRLASMDKIDTHLQGGAFLNYYLNSNVRFTNSLLYGAGGDGLVWEASLQRVAIEVADHQRLSLSGGVTVVNRAYNRTFFGITPREARNGLPAYAPDGGVKDVFVAARWNWALSPSWMVTTSVRASRLGGDARRSPLVERAKQFSISTGLAHRF